MTDGQPTVLDFWMIHASGSSLPGKVHEIARHYPRAFSAKRHIMDASSPVRAQSPGHDRSDHGPGDERLQDSTSGLRGRRYWEMEGRETRSYPRAAVGEGQPLGGQPRTQDDSAAR